MKEQLLAGIQQILDSSTSIKLHVDKVYELRMALDDQLTEMEKLELSFAIKNKVQYEANAAIDAYKGWGVFLGATGVGKSKIVVDRCKRTFWTAPERYAKARSRLIVVPTERLRDVTWRDEFVKWNCLHVYNQIEMVCYASLHKYERQTFDEVYFDEIHNSTDNSVGSFFKKNIILSCVGLTATKPNSKDKIDLFKSIGLLPVYEITVDEAIKLGIIAPYLITVVTTELDNAHKYLKAGNKEKSWFQTERSAYDYISKKIDSQVGTRFDLIARRRIFANSIAKTSAMKFILNLAPAELRGIIFCGSKKQAVDLCPYHYFTKPTKPKGIVQSKWDEYNYIATAYQGDESLNAFMREEINRIACVDALNEGINLPNNDFAAMAQVDSNPINFAQRLGRNVRFRPGHIGRVAIVGIKGTEDMGYIYRCTKGMTVRTISLEDLKAGKEPLFIKN